jgi:hypothetical protein
MHLRNVWIGSIITFARGSGRSEVPRNSHCCQILIKASLFKSRAQPSAASAETLLDLAFLSETMWNILQDQGVILSDNHQPNHCTKHGDPSTCHRKPEVRCPFFYSCLPKYPQLSPQNTSREKDPSSHH